RPMFLRARAAAATLAARDGRTSTTSTRSGSMRGIQSTTESAKLPLNAIAADAPPVTVLRPLPRRLTRALSALVVAAWIAQMSLLARRTLEASTLTLSGDLARYGTSAQWKGVYSRGEKIGYMVGQTVARDDGYELMEDGQLQMTLLGAS